jgi:hypothetical protein
MPVPRDLPKFLTNTKQLTELYFSPLDYQKADYKIMNFIVGNISGFSLPITS